VVETLLVAVYPGNLTGGSCREFFYMATMSTANRLKSIVLQGYEIIRERCTIVRNSGSWIRIKTWGGFRLVEIKQKNLSGERKAVVGSGSFCTRSER
jgi:hypothetical protein